MRKLKEHKMEKFGILAVYLFGSAVEGITTVRSDIDIGIVFESPKNLKDTRSLYNAIYSEISKTFKPTFQRNLDIVFLQKASITLQYDAITSGKLIYEKDSIKRADYEEKVVNHYMDFKPILEYFYKVASQRYAA